MLSHQAPDVFEHRIISQTSDVFQRPMLSYNRCFTNSQSFQTPDVGVLTVDVQTLDVGIWKFGVQHPMLTKIALAPLITYVGDKEPSSIRMPL
jgi:hypothetical protein